MKYLAYLLAISILLFTGVMFSKVLPYMGFEYAINFLGTKTDEVLAKPYYMIAFYIHITSSLWVMATGILQFFNINGIATRIQNERFSKRLLKWHRLLGKVYIISILTLAAPSGLIIAFYANGGLPAKVGFVLQCFVWWLLTYAAWREVLAKKYLSHIEMMLRSYAVTLAAMSLRTESYLMHYYFHTKLIETYLTVTWLSWVGNLFIIEIFIYFGLGKILFKKT